MAVFLLLVTVPIITTARKKAIFIQFTNCPVRWQCICISPMSSLLRDVIRRLPRMKLLREA